MAPDETGEAIDARARLVAWARGELGEQDPNKYYRSAAPQFADKGAEHSVSWCGVFVLAGLRECGLTDWQWETGRGFVYRLAKTADPQPGDVAVFQKGASGKDLWHHAIVASVDSGAVNTVDGNVLPAPREGVAERRRAIDSNATFYSIAQLLWD